MWTMEIQILNEDLIIKQLQINPKKIREFNRIWTHGLCIGAAVLSPMSYEDPYLGSRPMYVWVCANTEAMSSNPVEVSKFIFRLISTCLNCNDHCDDINFKIFINFINFKN